MTDGEGRKQLLDDLVGPRCLLVTLGHEPQSWLGEAAHAAWARLGGRRIAVLPAGSPFPPPEPGLTVVGEDDALLHDWMGQVGCLALLVRPDKYVFGGSSDAATLNRHISQLAGHLLGSGGTRP